MCKFSRFQFSERLVQAVREIRMFVWPAQTMIFNNKARQRQVGRSNVPFAAGVSESRLQHALDVNLSRQVGNWRKRDWLLGGL